MILLLLRLKLSTQKCKITNKVSTLNIMKIFVVMTTVVPASAAWSCSDTYSAGPCFTQAMNWTEAQKTCESHSSNLATTSTALKNGALGSGGCFSDAPWNNWECSWIGANDLRTEVGKRSEVHATFYKTTPRY